MQFPCLICANGLDIQCMGGECLITGVNRAGNQWSYQWPEFLIAYILIARIHFDAPSWKVFYNIL